MSARTEAVRRGGRRGSVTLEFVLTIPVYLLVLYAVMTVGDLGLTASQSHVGARMAAWRRTDDIAVERAVAGNLRRVSLDRGPVDFPALEVDGGSEQRSAPAWKSVEVPAAFNFSHHKLAAPFEDAGGGLRDAILDEYGIDEGVGAIIDEILSEIIGIDLGIDFLQGRGRILSNAMLGDLTKSGDAEKKDSGVPWMRRRYGSTSMRYRGAANMVASSGFRARHTVLLGDGYRSCKPNAYAGGGLFGSFGDMVATQALGRSLDLRASSAYGANGDNLLTGSGYLVGHQFETLRMVTELNPPYPDSLLTDLVGQAVDAIQE